MSTRHTRALALTITTVGLVLAVGTAVGWVIAGLTFRDLVETYTLTNLVIGLGFVASGGLIARFQGRNPIGWLFLACGIGHLGTAVTSAPLYVAVADDWPRAAAGTLSTLNGASWQFGLVGLFPLAFLLFPTGKLPSRRWVPLAWLTIASMVFQISTGALSDGNVFGDPAANSILSIGLDLPALVFDVANVANAAIVLLVVVSLIVRYVRGSEMERRQIFWLILALIIMLVLNSQRWLTGDGPILLLLSFTLVPIAITVAILRYRLLDIRLVVSRTLLYVLASLVVIAVYAGTVAALSLWLPTGGDRAASIVAALIVAVGFAPLRSLLQRLLDRAFFGSRSDPLKTATRLGEGLALSDNASSVLETTRRELRLPYLALRDTTGKLATAGEVQADRPEVSLPLAYGGQSVGHLVVGLRSGEQVLHDSDRRVFSLIGPSLALALHSTALADELRRSRAAIVAAREDERQRLHRELHDGLGPVLTGAAFRADAASNMLDDDPVESARLLTGVRSDIRRALDDVRRIVYGVRPLDLEEQGLVGALRARAAGIRGREGEPIDVRLEFVGLVDSLAPAAELAVYRIVIESLTNIARHSDARASTVRISVDRDVQVEITDDGIAATSPWSPGIGIASIRARAEELGGTADAGPTPSGGRVFARLPG